MKSTINRIIRSVTIAGPGRADAYTAAGWGVLFLATAAIILHDSSRSIVHIYRFAALSWASGTRIYELSGIGGFTYFPQAAILFLPFALLPHSMGEVLWRLVSIGVFAFGLWGFARLAGERSEGKFFLLVSLVAAPVAWDCARNGQATLLMTGLMLLAAVELARRRWWWATLWLALSVAIKPLSLVMVLLVVTLERKMTWRMLAGMLALAVFPFLTQSPSYVVAQYAACFQNMTTAVHVGVVAHGWTTPFTALRVTGIDVPESLQTGLRLAAAVAVLGLCYFVRLRSSAARSSFYLFSLATLYLMLFSPRTENNTYTMLGPAIGVFLADEFLVRKRAGEGIFLTGITLSLVASRVIERLVAPHAEQVWLSPLLAVCFGVYVLARLFREQAVGTGKKALAQESATENP